MIGPSRWLELLRRDNSDGYKSLAKRVSLFYTPSAKRITAEHISMLENIAVSNDEARIVSKYKSKNGYGIAVFDDTPDGDLFGSSVKERFNQQMESLGLTKRWDDIQSSRDDTSSFDSISYISTDMAKLISMQQGMDFDGTHFIWKPIISSDKPGSEAYVKTVFIHDPTMQHVFDKNQGLDVLVSKSAMKIGAERGYTFGPDGLIIQKKMSEIVDEGNGLNFLE